MDKDIKDYRNGELKNYVTGNILVVLITSGILDQILIHTGELTVWSAISALLSSALFSSVLYIYIFLADALVPGEWKNSLIWFAFGKPGEKVFTRIKENNKDHRFTTKEALKLYKDVYQEIDKADEVQKKDIENSAWYKIYKKHEKQAQVNVSQRDFLLCRDMTVMTIFTIIGYICLQCYRKQYLSWKMLLFFALEFIFSWLAAYNKCKRFTYNVIAIDLSTTVSKGNED